MYKLMIIDDEPLVQVAIKSMVNWEELNIDICSTAYNGQEALDLISNYLPHIVITDVKMPILDGLRLIDECKKIYKEPPVFIVLTNYDEFNLVQQALRLGAIDYIIKSELNEKVLINCVEKAIKKINANKTIEISLDDYLNKKMLEHQFFVYLLNGYYNSDKEIKEEINELLKFVENEFLGNFLNKFYCVIFSKITSFSIDFPNDYQIQLYKYTTNMVQEIMLKHFLTKIIPIDKETFAAIALLNSEDSDIENTIKATNEMVNNYFNVDIISGIGNIYGNLYNISNSYYEAMQAVYFSDKNKNVISYSEVQNNEIYLKNMFDIRIFRKNFIQAIREHDVEEMESIFEYILKLIKCNKTSYYQAFDICCNVLYLTLMTLDYADELLENIFCDEIGGYRYIFKDKKTESLIIWLEKFKDGLMTELNKRKNSHSNYLVTAVQKYISNNYMKKISLQEVASIFNISPNYLSSIFKKYTNINFSNYVSAVKIKHATEMLKSTDKQINEISDFLGFSDPYYFSKVFKKITGLSPKKYRVLYSNDAKAGVFEFPQNAKRLTT